MPFLLFIYSVLTFCISICYIYRFSQVQPVLIWHPLSNCHTLILSSKLYTTHVYAKYISIPPTMNTTHLSMSLIIISSSCSDCFIFNYHVFQQASYQIGGFDCTPPMKIILSIHIETFVYLLFASIVLVICLFTAFPNWIWFFFKK